MTIQNEITNLENTKAAIKQAIIDKGVTVSSSDGFATYPAKIAQIETEPTLNTLSVTPSTTSQTLTPPSGVDGYDEVVVSAVTSAIDADITAGNIKAGVEILGVTGSYTGEPVNLQSKTFAASSTTATLTTVTPDSGYDGLSAVTVDLSYIENRVDAINGTTVTPSGTTTITANGTYDVTNYASAEVNVATSTLYIYWQDPGCGAASLDNPVHVGSICYLAGTSYGYTPAVDFSSKMTVVSADSNGFTTDDEGVWPNGPVDNVSIIGYTIFQ